MPRAATKFKKSGPAVDPDDDSDRGAASHQRVVRTPAGAPIVKPAGAPASVFDMVRPPDKPASSRRPYTAPFDPTLVPIVKGVPVPDSKAGRDDRCKVLLDRMAPGDSVVLTHIQAKSVKAASKRLGVKVTARRLDDINTGIWRLE